MQAAVGCAQLEKFPSFAQRRRHNFAYLRQALKNEGDKIILPQACANSDPCWFGFLLTCKEGVSRNKVVSSIESAGIQTRMLFAGNLTRHPCFSQMKASGKGYRVVGGLSNTDQVMNDSFWVGVYPGLTDEMLEDMARAIKNALRP